jgi:hypothetical protein
VLSKLKTEPAWWLGLLGVVVAAVSQIIEAANAGGTFNVWTAITVGVPLVIGVAIRANVMSVEKLRAILDRADTGLDAARALNAEVKAQFSPTE